MTLSDVTIQLPKDFVRFLKENGIYTDYLCNVINVYKDTKICPLQRVDKTSLIIDVFTWALSIYPVGMTPLEKTNFWGNINIKWTKFCS